MKAAKRIDLKYSHHKKEMVIMTCGGVSEHYGGNRFEICKCRKSIYCTLAVTQLTCQL